MLDCSFHVKEKKVHSGFDLDLHICPSYSVGWCHDAVFIAGVVAHRGSRGGLPLCFAVLSEVAAVK